MFELAITDAKTFFYQEIPFMKSWVFTKNQVKDLQDKKVLHIKGDTKSRKISKDREDREDLLSYWPPQNLTISILNAPHMIQITNPKEVVYAMNRFLQNTNRL